MHTLGKSFLGTSASGSKNLQLLDDDSDSPSDCNDAKRLSSSQLLLSQIDTVLQLEIPRDNIVEAGGSDKNQATLSASPPISTATTKTDRRSLMVKAFSFTSRKTTKKISHIGEVDQDAIRKKLQVIQQQKKAAPKEEEEVVVVVAATSEHTTSTSANSSQEPPNKNTRRPTRSRSVPRLGDTEPAEGKSRRRSRRSCSNPKIRSSSKSPATGSSRRASSRTNREGLEASTRKSRRSTSRTTVNRSERTSSRTGTTTRRRRPRQSKSTEEGVVVPPPPSLNRATTEPDQKRRPTRSSKSTDQEQDALVKRIGSDVTLKRRTRPTKSVDEGGAVPPRATTEPNQKRKSRSSKKIISTEKHDASLRRTGKDEPVKRGSRTSKVKSFEDVDAVPPPPSGGLQRATTAPDQRSKPRQPSNFKSIEEEVTSKSIEEEIVFPPPLSGSMQRSSTDPQLIISSIEPLPKQQPRSSANSSQALLEKRASARNLRQHSDHNSRSRPSRRSDHNGSFRSLRYSEHGSSRSSRRERSTSQHQTSTRVSATVQTEQQEANISKSSSGPSLQQEDKANTQSSSSRPSLQRGNSERVPRVKSIVEDIITRTPRAGRPSLQRAASARGVDRTAGMAPRERLQRAASTKDLFDIFVEETKAIATAEARREAIGAVSTTKTSKSASSSRHQRRTSRMRPSSTVNAPQIAQTQLQQLDRDVRIKQLTRTEDEKKEAIQLLQQKYGTEGKETTDEQLKTPKQKRGSKMLLLKTLFTGSERNLKGASNHSTEKELPGTSIEGPMMTPRTQKRKSKTNLNTIENNKLEDSESSGMDLEQRADDPAQREPKTKFAVTA